MSKSRNKFILIIPLILAVVLLSVLAGFVLGRIHNDNAEDTAGLSEREKLMYEREAEDYYFTLGYMPEGFEIYEVQSDKTGYFNAFRSIKDNDVYFHVQKSFIPAQFGINTENAETKYVNINGNKAFYSSNSKINILIWNDQEQYQRYVMGTIDEKTIIKIAENME